MELMKQVMAILEKMRYNEWPSKITYERQHMMWSRVKITVATQKMMKDIETALKTFHEDLAVISDFVTVETKSIKRGGRIIHYRVTVHRKGDSMIITNSIHDHNRTAVVFPKEPTKNGDQEHVMMSKVEADALVKPTESPYLVCTKKMLNAFVSLAKEKATGVLVCRMESAGVEYPGQMHLTSEFRDECLDAHEAEGVAK
tara:strand:- start:162 stop:761 length:600 start_codon:yes stop_codon:yes gene_type:complete